MTGLFCVSIFFNELAKMVLLFLFMISVVDSGTAGAGDCQPADGAFSVVLANGFHEPLL